MSRLKKIISTMMCAMAAAAAFCMADGFLSRKISYVKNADFYGYDENFNILFLGTSHMIMGVSPMELWNDYGITSYNMADYGQWLPVDYWVLRNALDYTTPELVVVDVHAAGINDLYSGGHISQLHEVFDDMPLSMNKIKAVFELLPEEKRMEFLFPFSFYHTRWDSIDKSFWDKVSPSTEKGANLDNTNSYDCAYVTPVDAPVLLPKTQMNEEDTLGKQYLRKIIELCQAEDIQILLVALPYAPSEWEQMNLNSVQKIADEYGINYFNMNFEYDDINYNTDFYDAGHLNSSGAKKTTKALGQYLVDNYAFTDWNDNEIADVWDNDYIEYADYKNTWLKQQTSLHPYLMLLAYDEYEVSVTLSGTDIWKDNVCAELLENLGVETERMAETAAELKEHETVSIIVESKVTGQIVDEVTFDCKIEEEDGKIKVTTLSVNR